MEVELKHTWRVRRQAWYVRFYLWLYETPETQVTFCKLFWGYALLWLALPLGLLTKLLRAIKSVLPKSEPKEKPVVSWPSVARVERTFKPVVNHGYGTKWYVDGVEQEECAFLDRPNFVFYECGAHVIEVRIQTKGDLKTWRKEVEILPPVLPLRVVVGVADGFVWLKMHSRYIGRAWRVVTAPVWIPARGLRWSIRKVKSRLTLVTATVSFVLGFAALNGLASVPAGGIISQVPTWFAHTALPPLEIMGIVGGTVVVGCGCVLAILWVALDTPLGSAVSVGITTPARGVRSLFRAFGRGVREFAQAMRLGYVAVKSNTCPRIVVVDDRKKPE